MLAVWAYAYEIASVPMVDDATFDRVANQSNPAMITGRLDEWWRASFAPHTGQWIHDHPELPLVAALFARLTVDNHRHDHHSHH